MTTVLDHTAPIDVLPETPMAEAPVNAIPGNSPTSPTHVDSVDTVRGNHEAGFNEDGLRELTGHDYLVSSVWGIAGALATSAVSILFLPVHLLALTFILGAGLGVLGYLDHCTQLIRNKHNLVFGIAAALILLATQAVTGGAVLLPAVIAGAVTFVFMLALTVFTGFAGGGDIKLSPIPAALLAAVSPIAALLWLLTTFVLCLAGMITARLAGSKRKHVAMAPFMAVAAVLAILAYGMLSNTLGI
ncbi:hypothetical protein GCM10023063_20190 [Arthrobacter methylotrophus]|uniref:Prepilin peptidase n=1 Tax=Arthrobacter methylotrophus TaxID=121291 RepID=A0ABV5UXK7_9MICC